MDQVTAYKCWAVYADYDAMAPDTRNLFYVSTEELAKQACDYLNDDAHRTSADRLCYSEGHQHCRYFQAQPALLEDVSVVLESKEAFLIWLAEHD